MKSAFRQFAFPALVILLLLQATIYIAICVLSGNFEYSTPGTTRPILLVVGLFGVGFALHWFSLWLALAIRNEILTLRTIVLGAIAFRIIVLFSTPIQEVDIYRYIWDGAALRNGVSPFRYSPQHVLQASSEASQLSPELRTLVALRDQDYGLGEVLSRVHYGQLTTIYPPVSQAVFALADFLTPRGVSLELRVFIMKSVIVLFDLAVLAILAKLLAQCRLHSGWLIAYGWSPLVLKEFANSGHLDSIAVFFTTAAVLAFVLGAGQRPHPRRWLFGSGLLLALGIGAKLYPVVLIPLLAWNTWKRCGAIQAIQWSAWVIVAAGLLVLPMVWEIRYPPDDPSPGNALVEESELPPPPSETDPLASLLPEEPAPVSPPVPLPPSPTAEATGPRDGLTAFLGRWEMNDFLFMVLEENVRGSPDVISASTVPWFVVVPGHWRDTLVLAVERWTGIPQARVPFLLTRAVTLLIFGAVALWLALRAAQAKTQNSLLEVAFLTLAWFWLLSPTQNPWYWIWALPLIPFARGRAWLFVSGLSLIYYLRFWFLYQYPQQDLFWPGYSGTYFFDFVVVWLEFAPWMAILCLVALSRFRHR